MKNASLEHFPSENRPSFPGVDPEKVSEKLEDFMKTGLSKKQKTTSIYFNEKDSMIEVCTYNTSLKNRLTRFAEQYPAECRLINDDGLGCLTFEISKGRFRFKLTTPHSKARRKPKRKLASVDTRRRNTANLRGGIGGRIVKIFAANVPYLGMSSILLFMELI